MTSQTIMVEMTGLEPAASWSQTKHSTNLNYISILSIGALGDAPMELSQKVQGLGKHPAVAASLPCRYAADLLDLVVFAYH